MDCIAFSCFVPSTLFLFFLGVSKRISYSIFLHEPLFLFFLTVNLKRNIAFFPNCFVFIYLFLLQCFFFFFCNGYTLQHITINLVRAVHQYTNKEKQQYL